MAASAEVCELVIIALFAPKIVLYTACFQVCSLIDEFVDRRAESHFLRIRGSPIKYERSLLEPQFSDIKIFEILAQ